MAYAGTPIDSTLYVNPPVSGGGGFTWDPGTARLKSTVTENLQRQAEGLLDPETEQMLRKGIAESGMAGGFGVDSQNLASAYRRALGQNIAAQQAAAEKGLIDVGGLDLGKGGIDYNYYLQQQENQRLADELKYKYYATDSAANIAAANRIAALQANRYGNQAPSYRQTATPTTTGYTGYTGYTPTYTYGGTTTTPTTTDWTYSDVPENTYYSPGTDTYNYDYGLGNYWDTNQYLGEDFSNTDAVPTYEDWALTFGEY